MSRYSAITGWGMYVPERVMTKAELERMVDERHRAKVVSAATYAAERCELAVLEYARNDDGDGFCEVHVNTIEGFWSLLRSWLRPHRGISQDKLPLYLGFFQFVHNARRRGRALLGAFVGGLVG